MIDLLSCLLRVEPFNGYSFPFDFAAHVSCKDGLQLGFGLVFSVFVLNLVRFNLAKFSTKQQGFDIHVSFK